MIEVFDLDTISDDILLSTTKYVYEIKNLTSINVDCDTHDNFMELKFGFAFKCRENFSGD